MAISLIFVLAALLLGAVVVALFVWWLLVLIDCLRTPDAVWQAAGENQVVWLLVLILLGFVGAILYVLLARPKVRAIA